jgi:ABC-2 type transport system permease protein
MSLYRRLLINTFKAKFVFRMNYLLNLLFNFFYIVLQIYIWKGLYGSAVTGVSGVSLQEMIAYTIFSSMTQMLTDSETMTDINGSVQDGSITNRLLLPLEFRAYYLMSDLSGNLFWSLYNSLPPILVSILFFGLHFNFSFVNLAFYAVAVALAFFLNFMFSFIMGMSVIWFKNAFFLENLKELAFKLFSGAIVPLWLFPGWLDAASRFLPFRYIVFEPVSVLLGKTPMEQIPAVLGWQVFWICVLYGGMTLVWNRGRRHIMLHGG